MKTKMKNILIAEFDLREFQIAHDIGLVGEHEYYISTSALAKIARELEDEKSEHIALVNQLQQMADKEGVNMILIVCE